MIEYIYIALLVIYFGIGGYLASLERRDMARHPSMSGRTMVDKELRLGWYALKMTYLWPVILLWRKIMDMMT